MECPICLPLTDNSEKPVRKVDLCNSANNGCSTCSLLWRACKLAGDISSVDHAISWAKGSLYGISLETDDPEVRANAEPWTPIIFLAADGGRVSPLSTRPSLIVGREIILAFPMAADTD